MPTLAEVVRDRTDGAAGIDYFVEWRTTFWKPAVEWLLGDPGRFVGKRVLDLGCGDGRISCLFGLLGATVHGVDVEAAKVVNSRKELQRWQVGDRVEFIKYDGNPLHLPEPNYDFVFTKSSLVTVPRLEEFLPLLARKLNPGGELMLAENLKGGFLIRNLRRFVFNRSDPGFYACVKCVDANFISVLSRTFEIRESRKYYGVTIAIRAQNRSFGS